ncbi:MAG: hypothetical protein ACLFP8_08390 [Alphaproteobacteria bacterium]
MLRIYLGKAGSVLLLSMLCLLLFKTELSAQDVIDGIRESLRRAEYEEVFTPEMGTTSVLIDDDAEEAEEPNISETTFLKYPPVGSVDERVDRLLFGIETQIQPEFDHYGHEIRRYMVAVGNMRIFDDYDFLLEQYRNVKKAEIIAKYWMEHLEKEVKELEEIMDTDSTVSLAVRTKFRQNRVAMRSFSIRLKSWIDANKALLERIGNNQEIYIVEYPEIIITSMPHRVQFFNAFALRQAKLKDIQTYAPFAMMVY